jgi:hypothetical protein
VAGQDNDIVRHATAILFNDSCQSCIGSAPDSIGWTETLEDRRQHLIDRTEYFQFRRPWAGVLELSSEWPCRRPYASQTLRFAALPPTPIAVRH